VAPKLLGPEVVRVGTLPARKIALLTKEALSASDREWHYDAIADLQLLVLAPNLDDLPHRFGITPS
jgi:hypothetical protein